MAARVLVRMVAHQCAAKGRHKSTWKFFRSLNLMAASMYTNSIHKETVGKHTPLSGEEIKNKYYSTLSINTHNAHTVYSSGGKPRQFYKTGCGLVRYINTHVASYGCECHR